MASPQPPPRPAKPQFAASLLQTPKSAGAAAPPNAATQAPGGVAMPLDELPKSGADATLMALTDIMQPAFTAAPVPRSRGNSGATAAAAAAGEVSQAPTISITTTDPPVASAPSPSADSLSVPAPLMHSPSVASPLSPVDSPVPQFETKYVPKKKEPAPQPTPTPQELTVPAAAATSSAVGQGGAPMALDTLQPPASSIPSPSPSPSPAAPAPTPAASPAPASFAATTPKPLPPPRPTTKPKWSGSRPGSATNSQPGSAANSRPPSPTRTTPATLPVNDAANVGVGSMAMDMPATAAGTVAAEGDSSASAKSVEKQSGEASPVAIEQQPLSPVQEATSSPIPPPSAGVSASVASPPIPPRAASSAVVVASGATTPAAAPAAASAPASTPTFSQASGLPPRPTFAYASSTPTSSSTSSSSSMATVPPSSSAASPAASSPMGSSSGSGSATTPTSKTSESSSTAPAAAAAVSTSSSSSSASSLPPAHPTITVTVPSTPSSREPEQRHSLASATSSSSALQVGSTPSYIVSPKVSQAELMNKDSSDAALQRYKQSLLGGATSTAKFPDDPRQIVFEKVELVAEGRTPIVLDIYDPQLAKKPFVLKEGANFHLILYFYVQHDMVSGLKFSTTITKFGVAVDKTEEMIGSFACGEKLIKYRMPEESAPSGMMMRTSFSAQGKLQDDDDKVHAQWNYAFEIKKNWP